MPTTPYFLDLVLDKYEVCCAVQHDGELCERDASEELVATHPDGQTFYIPLCGDKLHKLKAVGAKKHIESGQDPKLLTEVAYHGLFLQPQGVQQKCKMTEWDKFSMPIGLTDYGEKPTKKYSTKKTHLKTEAIEVSQKIIKAPASWQWIEDSFKWMDTDGEVKSLSKMSQQHLILTALAIRDGNYQSCPKKIAWTKSLVAPSFKLQYPEGALVVGVREAGAKLEEFEEVLAELGVL
jgi:hypothetical protein